MPVLAGAEALRKYDRTMTTRRLRTAFAELVDQQLLHVAVRGVAAAASDRRRATIYSTEAGRCVEANHPALTQGGT